MNRIVADHVSDLCFAPTAAARDNLLHEGIPEEHIRVTGNTVVDALLATARDLSEDDAHLSLPSLPRNRDWLLVTARRRENHGAPLEGVCAALRRIAEESGDHVHVIYPVHRSPLVWGPVHERLGSVPGITLLPAGRLSRYSLARAPCPPHPDRLGRPSGRDAQPGLARPHPARDHRAPRGTRCRRDVPGRHRSRRDPALGLPPPRRRGGLCPHGPRLEPLQRRPRR